MLHLSYFLILYTYHIFKHYTLNPLPPNSATSIISSAERPEPAGGGGFRGLGFRVLGLGFRALGLGSGLGLEVYGLGFRI